jgi:hypothetical protein
MRPSIGMKLKATVNLGDAKNGEFRFPLKRRNYDLLRISTQVPRLLVVLDLPPTAEQWLTVTHESLILRRSAYWMSPAGAPETDNETSVTVSIDTAHRLDTHALRTLMEQSRTGVIR